MEMHPLTKLVVGVVAVLGIAGVIVVARHGDQLDVETSQASQTPPETPEEQDPEAPPLSPTGPHPKAVVDDPMYEFDVMAVGSSQTHAFEIRNEGEAPLLLTKKSTSCRCTGVEVPTEPIPPGESVLVEVTWETTGIDESFLHGAELWTNDPENRVLSLQVSGAVDEMIRVEPSDVWPMGTIPSQTPKTVTGMVFSRILDEFHITEPLEGSTPLLTAKVFPMPDELLAQLHAKSGYEIRATLEPDTGVGPFRELLRIQTDVPEVGELKIALEGVRRGPITIVATGGVTWYPDNLYLDLGRFQAEQGAQVKLIMFVTPPEDGAFKILGVDTDPGFLKFTAVRDEQFQAKGREKYELTISVPPGSPPATRSNDNLAQVELTTNHPQVEHLLIRVRFTSQ